MFALFICTFKTVKQRFHTLLKTPLGVMEISGTNTFVTAVEFVIDEEEDSKEIQALEEKSVVCDSENL